MSSPKPIPMQRRSKAATSEVRVLLDDPFTRASNSLALLRHLACAKVDQLGHDEDEGDFWCGIEALLRDIAHDVKLLGEQDSKGGAQ